ncbi:MAG: class I SAM-dependent methyltransferase, partial [Atopobiaceae bacterium]|nr:class I SAM-dependent methyltransferase [Atopobiaceae bacterium]
MELRGDFARLLPRLRQDRLHRELLVRAARVRGVDAPTAVDATAGLGEDALLLAAAGFTVTLCERDPVIAALLADTLLRARDDERLSKVAARMRLVEGDARETLASLDEAPDVVFLDPMFPERRRRASTNKKLQLFQVLERPCEDEDALMAAALAAR